MVNSQKAGWGLVVWLVPVAGLILLVAAGCSNNLYSSCDTNLSQCQGTESCVASPVYQCDSRVCGIYRDPDAMPKDGFCTKPCQKNSECPGGQCREFVVGTGEKYCVPSNKLSEK